MGNLSSKSRSNDSTQPAISGTISHSSLSKYKLVERIAKFASNSALKSFFSTSVAINEPVSVEIMARKFLQCVAYGQQDVAENIVKHHAKQSNPQWILTVQTFVTDYSGRSFNCSAYEYAYWAKDTHMCRMLEKYMDESTKVETLCRCKAIEANGLTYEQHGRTILGSRHFDLTILINALQDYIEKYRNHNMKTGPISTKAIALAQRDVPVHVINEYCRKDRSFELLPSFDEKRLPRELTYTIEDLTKKPSFFPLASLSEAPRPLFRANRVGWCSGMLTQWTQDLGNRMDLLAITNLDRVRTQDLLLSLEILGARGSQDRALFQSA